MRRLSRPAASSNRYRHRPLDTALPVVVRSVLPAGDVLALSIPLCCPVQQFPSSCPSVPTTRTMAGDETTPLLDVDSMQKVDDVVAVATPEDLVHHRSLYDLRPGGWGRDMWFYWCNEVRCAGLLWRQVGRERGNVGGFFLVAERYSWATPLVYSRMVGSLCVWHVCWRAGELVSRGHWAGHSKNCELHALFRRTALVFSVTRNGSVRGN